MVHTLVLTKLIRAVECFGTWKAGVQVSLAAGPRLLLFMHRYDVSLESAFLSESLVASLIPLTSISILTFVRLKVSSQSCAGEKAFTTAFPSTFVPSLLGVSTLDVVLQVSLPQVILGATGIRTFEYAQIVMRSQMLIESCLTIEGLVTTLARTP